MFTGTLIGCHISHTVTLQIGTSHSPFIRIFVRLVSFHPHDLSPSRKRSQDSALQIPVPTFRLPATSSESMKAGNHTSASTNKPLGLAFLMCSDRGQKISSIDRLLEPRRGQPLSPVSV
eukprot:528309-Amphidinium_carterae.1